MKPCEWSICFTQNIELAPVAEEMLYREEVIEKDQRSRKRALHSEPSEQVHLEFDSKPVALSLFIYILYTIYILSFLSPSRSREGPHQSGNPPSP